MKLTSITATAILSLTLIGCSTTQEVLLAKASPSHQVVTVAQVADEDNSSDMDAHLTRALQIEGLAVKAPLPSGTRTAPDVDAIVSYSDVWRWDLVMYLKSISIRMFDAQSGDLLVSGEWNDSALHGFRDPQVVVHNLIREMLTKIRSTPPTKSGS